MVVWNKLSSYSRVNVSAVFTTTVNVNSKESPQSSSSTKDMCVEYEVQHWLYLSLRNSPSATAVMKAPSRHSLLKASSLWRQLEVVLVKMIRNRQSWLRNKWAKVLIYKQKKGNPHTASKKKCLKALRTAGP